jgi:hypothetical protein
MGESHGATRNWGLFDRGSHCKYKISANSKLMGKIMLDFTYVFNAKIYVVMMPNDFN